jgi:hypothetical protein
MKQQLRGTPPAHRAKARPTGRTPARPPGSQARWRRADGRRGAILLRSDCDEFQGEAASMQRWRWDAGPRENANASEVIREAQNA